MTRSDDLAAELEVLRKHFRMVDEMEPLIQFDAVNRVLAHLILTFGWGAKFKRMAMKEKVAFLTLVEREVRDFERKIEYITETKLTERT